MLWSLNASKGPWEEDIGKVGNATWVTQTECEQEKRNKPIRPMPVQADSQVPLEIPYHSLDVFCRIDGVPSL